MADEMLEIGARVDTAAIASGMASNAQAVQSATAQMKGSFEQTAQASSQAKQKLVEDRKAEAAAAKEAAAAHRQAMIQQQRDLEDYINKAEGVEKASHAAVSGVQATSGAIRTLEGNAGIRAVENFIAKTLGLGPAMQAIFPIIGGLAFGKILLDIGEKIYEVGSKAAHAAQMTGDAFSALHEKATVTNDDLAITADRLQLEIDKLSGKPGDGLHLAMDIAKKDADELRVRLRQDRDELDKLLSEHDVGKVGEALSGVASTGEQHKQMIADQRELSDAVGKAGDAYNSAAANAKSLDDIKHAADIRDAAIHAAFQKQIDSYRAEKIRLAHESAQAEMESMSGDRGAQSIDNSAKIAAIDGRTSQLVDAQARGDAEIRVAALTGEKDLKQQEKEQAEEKKRAASEAATAARAAAQARLRGIEEEAENLKASGNSSAKAEYEFWKAHEAAFAKGSSEYLAVQRHETSIAVEGAKKFSEEVNKLKEEAKKDAAEGEKVNLSLMDPKASQMGREAAENFLRMGPRWEAYWKEVGKGQQIEARNAEAMQLLSIQNDEASGKLSHLGALQAEAKIHAKEHADEISILTAELAALQAQMAKNGGNNDPTLDKQIAEAQNAVKTAQGKADQSGGQDAAAIAKAKAAPYMAATQQITSGLSGALTSWEKGQGSFTAAWGKSLGSMVTGLQSTLVHMGGLWVLHYAQQRILHLATAATKRTSDVATAAVSKATSASVAKSQGGNAAVTAAQHAYSSTATIPIIGPALAPVAAAGAFIAVEALGSLASAQGGWGSVPADNTLANLHKNEMVLPAHLADGVRKMTGGSSSITNHFGGNTIQAGSGESFPAQLDRHEDALAYKVSSLMRDGHPAFAGG